MTLEPPAAPASASSPPPDWQGLAAAMLAASQDGVVLLDADGAVVDCNERVQTLTGFGRAEVLGLRPPFPWWDREHLAQIAEAFSRALETGRVEEELPFRHRNGRRLIVIVSTAAIEAPDGSLLGYVATYKDVTARRHTEAEARGRRDDYAALARAFPAEWVALFDGARRTLLVEGKAAAPAGTPVRELLPAPFGDRVEAACRQALDGEETHLRVGSGRVFDLHVLPVAGNGGERRGVAVCREVTAEENAARRLLELAERLEEAQRLAGVGSWELDLASGRRTLSAGSFRLFGMTPDSDPSFAVEQIHPDDRDRVAEALRVAATGGRFDVTYRVRRGDGQERFVRGRGEAVERDGRTQIVGTVQDVTDQARAEAAARAHAERLAAIVAVQQEIATSEADVDGVLQLVCERAAALAGADGAVVEMVERDELVYRAATGLAAGTEGLRVPLHASLSGCAVREQQLQRCDDAHDDARVDRSACERLGVRSMLVVPLIHGRRTLGALAVLSAERRSFTDAEARVLQVLSDLVTTAISRARDAAAQSLLVDELRGAVDALAASEARVRSILSGAHEAFLAVDEDDRVTDWNPASEALFGWRAQEALGRQLADLIVPASEREELGAAVEQFRRTGTGPLAGRRIELEVLRRDGRTFPAELTVTAIQTRRGVGLSMFLHDISERKRQDAQRERLLAHERAQVERLRELDHIKDRLVSTISHELRTPLTSITGYVDLLLEDADALAPEQRGFLDVVQRNADRLLRLVGDLLDLYRLDQLGLAGPLVPLDLGELVQRAVEAIRPAARAAGLTLEAETQPLPVAADATPLAQAVDNVLSNAVKYTPSGGSVRIGLHEADGQAVVSVTDTGIGIPAADRDRLFERFYRSASAVERGIQGTGLGLALTRDILAAHGGTIEHRDAPDGGSAFLIRLPLAAASAAA